MSASTMAQASEITEKLRRESRDNVQKLVENFDLVDALMKGDPGRIDREAFAALMAPPVPQIFSTPEEILQYFLDYSKSQGWEIDHLVESLVPVPRDHVSTLDNLLTLDIWLGDLSTTFEALAGWIEYQQKQAGNGFWRWDGLRSDAEHLRLLNPKRSYGDKPSVRWVRLDMTANRGKAPKEVRDKSSAGLEVMSALAVHPNYPPAIDYETIPGVWAAGLQSNVPGRESWARVPILDWHRLSRKVSLDASWDGRRDDYAVPVVREL